MSWRESDSRTFRSRQRHPKIRNQKDELALASEINGRLRQTGALRRSGTNDSKRRAISGSVPLLRVAGKKKIVAHRARRNQ